MKNLLLGIIAINLTIISINLTLRSIEPVNAQSGLQRVQICGSDYNCADVSPLGDLKVLSKTRG